MVTQAKYLPVSDFQEVYGIIQAHRQRVAGAVNRESLTMIGK